MKEYTVTYTAEVTTVWKSDEHSCEFEETYLSGPPEEMAEWLEAELEADDVQVKKVKVFPREVNEDD